MEVRGGNDVDRYYILKKMNETDVLDAQWSSFMGSEAETRLTFH